MNGRYPFMIFVWGGEGARGVGLEESESRRMWRRFCNSAMEYRNGNRRRIVPFLLAAAIAVVVVAVVVVVVVVTVGTARSGGGSISADFGRIRNPFFFVYDWTRLTDDWIYDNSPRSQNTTRP